MLKNQLIVLCLLLSITAFAQEYTFKVLISKGSVIQQTSSSSNNLKTGDLLNSGDVLILGNGGYLGLVHSTGKILDLKKEGTYKVDDLESDINSTSPSESQKYGQYIAMRLSDSEKDRIRSGQRGLSDGQKIQLILPAQADLLGNSCVLRWNVQKAVEIPTFRVKISNVFGDAYMEMETQEESINVDLAELENDMGLFVFNVSHMENSTMKSSDYTVKKLKKDDVPEIVNSLDKLMNEMGGESPLEVLILASFYEENELLVDAIREYEVGIKKFPEVQGFYEMFLSAYELE